MNINTDPREASIAPVDKSQDNIISPDHPELEKIQQSVTLWVTQQLEELYTGYECKTRPSVSGGVCLIGPTVSGKSCLRSRLVRKGICNWACGENEETFVITMAREGLRLGMHSPDHELPDLGPERRLWMYISNRITEQFHAALVYEILSSNTVVPATTGGLVEAFVAIATKTHMDKVPMAWLEYLDKIPWSPKLYMYHDIPREERLANVMHDTDRRRSAIKQDEKIVLLYRSLINGHLKDKIHVINGYPTDDTIDYLSNSLKTQNSDIDILQIIQDIKAYVPIVLPAIVLSCLREDAFVHSIHNVTTGKDNDTAMLESQLLAAARHLHGMITTQLQTQGAIEAHDHLHDDLLHFQKKQLQKLISMLSAAGITYP